MNIFEESSHMPFRARIDDHEILFFCTMIDGVWKIHFQIDDSDEIFKIQTQTLDKDIECAPTFSPAGNGKYFFSFVSGQAKRCLFYSQIEHHMALLEPFEQKRMAITYAGFVSEHRAAHIIQKQDRPYVIISDRPGMVLMLPERFCYRVSFQFDDPEVLLISGAFEDGEIYSLSYNLQTDEQYLLYDNYIPMYKASIYEETYEYAQKSGPDFEDRHIVKAENPVFKEADGLARFIDAKEMK